MGDNYQNIYYLSELPKESVSSKKIAMIFEEKAGINISQPQIRRDVMKPFYSAVVRIDDQVQFDKAREAIRYFEIDGKQCRALAFDKLLWGTNKEKLISSNVFVAKIPKDMKNQELHAKMEKYGKIMSLKISLNADHSSRGYGFVQFQNEEAAKKAQELSKNDETCIAVQYNPVNIRSAVRKMINNVYVKNIPAAWSSEKVREMFAKYGNIKSLVLDKNEFGQYGFVCYDDEKSQNKEYGPQCAQAAIEGLNGMDVGENLKLYVKHAMKKTERAIEKTKETLKYKQSKKRCNLYVKNFPQNWTEDTIKGIFAQYGEIERIKLEKGRANNVYAFVCFSTPDAAVNAKQQLHNQTYDGKALIITHYEIKEFRQIHIEEAIDKQDFEKYNAQKSGGFHLSDLLSQPHMIQLIQQLSEILQQNEAMNVRFNQSERRMNPNHMRRQQNFPGGGRPHPGMNMQPGQPMPMPGMPQPQRMMPKPPMPSAPQPGPGGMQQHPGQQMNATVQRYLQATQKLLPAITEKNPHMRDQVGGIIFEYIKLMVPIERVPKITGMLIELPIDMIMQYMMSFEALQAKVNEANTMIDKAEGVQE